MHVSAGGRDVSPSIRFTKTVDHHYTQDTRTVRPPGEKETSMSDMYGQTEKALSKGADYVDQARGDVKNKCGVLSGNIQTMMAGWGGQGASAFNNLMISWDQKQETILKALDQLSASMKETERDNVSTDENQSATHTNLQGRLG
jgi:WXG100 family type VII secretion target